MLTARHSPTNESNYGQAHLFPRLSQNVYTCTFSDFTSSTSVNDDLPWTTDDVNAIVGHRLAGVALRLHRTGQINLPDWAVQHFRAAEFQSTQYSLAIVRTAEQAIASLECQGIPYVVTKGLGIANVAGGIVERPFSDVDVLVSRDDFPRAHKILGKIGYQEAAVGQQPWRSFNVACREAINLRLEPYGSIDLHHRIPPWLWGQQIRTADVVGAGIKSQALSVSLAVLPPEFNLLIVALHVVSDRGRPGTTLMVWRDFLTLAQAVDPANAIEVATRYRLLGWLQWIVEQYPQELRPQNLVNALSSEVTPKQRIQHHRRLQHLLPPSIHSRHIIGQTMRLPAPRALLYVAGMAIPPPSFLRARLAGRRCRYIHWWKSGLVGLAAEFGGSPQDVSRSSGIARSQV